MPHHRTVFMSTNQYEAELRTGTASFLDVIRVAKRQGLAGIEFRDVYWKNAERDIPEVKAALADHGIWASYASFTTLFDATVNRDALHREIDIAASIGSSLIRLFPGQTPALSDTNAWSAAKQMVAYAANHGVTIALENFAGTPGNRLSEAKTVFDNIDSAALRCNLDIGNYASNGQDPIEAIRVLATRIASSHLKDVKQTESGKATTYLGDGQLPLADIMAEFDRLPQLIVHCFEFGGNGDPEGNIVKSLAVLSRI